MENHGNGDVGSVQPITWKRVAPGVYESACGRFSMYRIPGVYPPAWNVEWATDYAYAHRWSGDAVDCAVEGNWAEEIADGCARMHDAVAVAEEWWQEHGAAIVAAEHAMPVRA